MALAFVTIADTSSKPSFGLKKGAHWTYLISSGEEKREYELLVDKVFEEKLQKVFEIVVLPSGDNSTGRQSFRYQALRGNGLYELEGTRMFDRGYKSESGDPVLLSPMTKGSTWTWTAPYRGQLAGDANPKEWAQKCSAKVEVVDESVTVPAGTYTCFRVRVTQRSQANGASSYIDWISPDVGLVKRMVSAHGESPAIHWELTKFKAGQ